MKKDGFKSNYSKVTFSEDKKSATIDLSSKITKGEYTVNVSGLVEGKTLTGSVTTADEKVSGIEILSDIAPVNSDSTKATVGFKVVNQYNEDVTKTNASSLVKSVAGAKDAEVNADGSINITANTTFKEGDKVVLTLVDPQTATSVTKTVTISSASKVAEVSFGTLYNKDGKSLNEDTDLSKDSFFLPVEVKDQYGKVVSNLDRLNGKAAVGETSAIEKEVIVTNTNPSVINFGKFEKQTINGKEVTVLPVTENADGVVRAGDATATVIAASNGKNAQATVKVAEGVKTDVVTLSAPTGVVVANEDVYLPISVMGKDGSAITDLKVINDASKGVKITNAESKVVLKDGSLFVKVDGESVKKDTPVTVVVTSATNKVVTQTIMPKTAAEPKVITGLQEKSTSIRPSGHTTINYTNVKIEDQYGRVMSKNAVKKLLDEGYSIEAHSDADAKLVASGSIKKNGEDSYSSITVTAAADSGKVSENITFVLNKAGDLNSTAFDAKFNSVPNTEFTSYKVADISTIYVKATEANADVYEIPNEAYEKAVTVKAVTKDGGEVTLEAGNDKDYTVKSGALSNVEDSAINKEDVKGITFEKDATTTTAKVTVTINETGEEFVKEITFSKSEPKVQKVELVKDTTAAGKDLATLADTTLEGISASEYDGEGSFTLTELYKLADVVVTDQYGVKAAVSEADDETNGIANFAGTDTSAATLTLSKVSGEVAFTANGTETAAATGKADSVFNGRVNINGQNASLKVTANKNFTLE